MNDRTRAFRGRVFCLTAGLLLAFSTASATTWQVGPTRAKKVPSAVSGSVADGDIVEIDAASYTNDVTNWSANNLTIRGVGGRPSLISNNGILAQTKAIWVISGTNTTIQNIELSGAYLTSANGGNGAGIRQQADTLTLRNCYIHDNNDGILVGASATSDILFEYCEFFRNGYTNYADNPGGNYVGYAHNIYIGQVRSFTLRYCYSHSSAGEGHVVKSRATTNYILYNRITDESTGWGSYVLQLAQGGLSFVVGNLIEKGSGAINHSWIICYADENQSNPIQNLYFANNTVVNDYGGSPVFFHVGGTPGGKVVNNIFVGPGTITDAGAALVFTNNLTWTITQKTQLVNAASFDYHLIPTSSAIDWGETPGVFSNFDLTPIYEYVYPTTCAVRQVAAALDCGAYEATSFTSAYQHVTSLLRTNGNLVVNWRGNAGMTQYLDYCTNLTNSVWISVATNAPGATTYFTKTNAMPNPTGFFRSRGVKP